MFKNCLECIFWNYSCLFYSGEWPTEDEPSDESTEPYNVGPIEMVQRLCIVMLPRVPSKHFGATLDFVSDLKLLLF